MSCVLYFASFTGDLQSACECRRQRVRLRDRRNNPHTTAIGPMPLRVNVRTCAMPREIPARPTPLSATDAPTTPPAFRKGPRFVAALRSHKSPRGRRPARTVGPNAIALRHAGVAGSASIRERHVPPNDAHPLPVSGGSNGLSLGGAWHCRRGVERTPGGLVAGGRDSCHHRAGLDDPRSCGN